jgi:amino acid transporter
MINIISNKASKNLGQTGLVLKTIPLYVIILGAIVLMAVAGPTTPIDEIVIDDTVGMFEGIMLALPAIMFTFDGFVYSASMQNEAKDHKTFMMA